MTIIVNLIFSLVLRSTICGCEKAARTDVAAAPAVQSSVPSHAYAYVYLHDLTSTHTRADVGLTVVALKAFSSASTDA